MSPKGPTAGEAAGRLASVGCEHVPVGATRLVTLEDAPVLAELLSDSREFLAPYEPDRSEEYFAEEGQRTVIQNVLAKHEQGTTLPHVILDAAGEWRDHALFQLVNAMHQPTAQAGTTASGRATS